MENLVLELTATSDKKAIDAALASINAAVAKGYTPNLFACKLAVGKEHTGLTTGQKWARTWENTNGKGIILTVEANFNGVKERITCSTVAEWESFGKESDITVNVKLNSKQQPTAFIVKTAVAVTTKKKK